MSLLSPHRWFKSTHRKTGGAALRKGLRPRVEALESRTLLTGDFVNAFSLGNALPQYPSTIETDTAGDVYITGQFEGTVDFDPGVGVDSRTAVTNDLFVAKYSANGNLIWVKQFSQAASNSYAYAAGMDVNAAGEVWLTGSYGGTWDFDPDAGTVPYTSNGGSGYPDIFVMRLNADGSLAWAKSIGGPTYMDNGRDIVVDASDNCYVVGTFADIVDFDPDGGVHDLTSNSYNQDVFVLQLDPTGALGWVGSIGGINQEYAVGVVLDSNANLLIAGSFNSTMDFDPTAGVFNIASKGSDDGFVCKLTSAGNFVWARVLGSAFSEYPNAIAVDSQDNVYTTGVFATITDLDPGPDFYFLESVLLSQDAFVSKLDSDGNFVWGQTFGGVGSDYPAAMTIGADDHLYITGQFQSVADMNPGPNTYHLVEQGGGDGFLLSLEADGDFAWAGAIGGANFDSATSVAVSGTVDVFIAGYFGSDTIDADPGPSDILLTNAGINGSADIFLAHWTNLGPNLVNPGSQNNLEGDSVSLGLFASDPSADVLEFSATGLPLGLTIDPLTGIISGTIDPNAASGNPYSVTVFVTDHTTTVSAIFTWSVMNPDPAAFDDSYSFFEDTFLDVNGSGLLLNDIDDDILTTILNSLPSNGTLDLKPDGSFVYVPNPNFEGIDTFAYVVFDGSQSSLPALVTINVEPINDAPTAMDDSFVVTRNSLNNLLDVLGNDIFAPDGFETLTISGFTPPVNGTVQNLSTHLIYTPTVGHFGPVSFTYTISDGNGGTATATVTIKVNAAPQAVSDMYSVNEDSFLLVPAANGVLFNDFPVDGDPITAVLVANPTGGTVSLDSNGRFFYIPNPNFNGIDTFSYFATDGLLQSSVVNVDINVVAMPDGITGIADNYNVAEDGSITRTDLTGILPNDLNPDGGVLTASLVFGPSHGILNLNPDGSFTYTPTPNYSGLDAFFYVATNGSSTSGPTLVSFNVQASNDDPTAVNDPAAVGSGGFVDVNVLANDSDVDDGQTLSLLSVGTPLHGSTQMIGNVARYTPTPGYVGPDSFTYVVDDGNGGQATGTVNVTVSPGVSFQLLQSSISEAGKKVKLVVTATPVQPTPFTVNYAVTGGDASSGTDFTILGTGALTIKANKPSAVIKLKIVNDTADENDETVQLTLSNPNNGVLLGANAQHTLTITDNDPVTLSRGRSADLATIDAVLTLNAWQKRGRRN